MYKGGEKMRPILLLTDSGITEEERTTAVKAIEKVAAIFQRDCYVLDGEGSSTADSIVIKAKEIRSSTYGPQLDVYSIVRQVLSSERHRKYPWIEVFLTSFDLTALCNGHYLNFCFGVTAGDVTVQSVARFRGLSETEHKIMLEGVIQHELGHIFGLASDLKRPHVRYKLGMHCTNYGCVMNQGMSLNELLDVFKAAKMMGRIYCPECLREAKRVKF